MGETTTTNSLAVLRERAGKLLAARAFAEAIPAYEELRAALARQFGEGHPHVALVDETLGGVARAAGDLALARRFFEAARSVQAPLDPLRASTLTEVLRHLDPLPAETLSQRPVLRLQYENSSYRIDRDVYFIGRGIERVHLYIHGDLLSRVHARVLWKDAFLFEDCASENGTLYDGQTLRCPQVIRDGDVFLLGGRVRVEFNFDA